MCTVPNSSDEMSSAKASMSREMKSIGKQLKFKGNSIESLQRNIYIIYLLVFGGLVWKHRCYECT